MKAIILSGISGAGKSTYIDERYPTAPMCSADTYFTTDGVYKFDATRLGEVHAQCLRWFITP